jgi:hypothetical protein
MHTRCIAKAMPCKVTLYVLILICIGNAVSARSNFNSWMASSRSSLVTNPSSLSGRPDDDTLPRGGASTSGTTAASATPDSSLPIRVAYQGEPGAYSEKSTRELLGEKVIAVGRPSFEACFRAVASMECDYACLPIENSLGGSIHENYDLMLRYDLTIIAEHEFRVKHCLLAKEGVKREDIKYAISHRKCRYKVVNY